VNRDTPHPVFHGCIDWHSAVHGNYALRVISRLTGDPSAAEIANSVAHDGDLMKELVSINAGDLDGEIPYGFSWFLILDREASSPDMAPLAVAISARVRKWVTDHINGDEILRPDYQNLAFAAFALHRWYVSYSADEAARFRREVAPSLVAHSGVACLDSRPATEFFDTCASLLLALADFDTSDDSVVTGVELEELAAAVRRQEPLPPEQVSTVHAAGLNFSRSWALYVAAAALNKEDMLANGDDYFLATLNAPELWRDNYRTYGHWVAQFGILALDLRSQTRARLLRAP